MSKNKLAKTIVESTILWIFQNIDTHDPKVHAAIAEEIFISIEHLWGIWSTGIHRMPDSKIKELFDEANKIMWNVILKDLEKLREGNDVH